MSNDTPDPFRAKVAEATRRMIGHTLLLDCLAHRFDWDWDGRPEVDRLEKLREAVGGAHAGAQEIQDTLQEAMGHLPEPDTPPTKEIDLGVILGLILMNREDVPDRIVRLAREISDRHGYNREALGDE